MPQEQFHYAHTGWREIDGSWVFLHAGGALSQVSQEASSKKEYLTQLINSPDAASEAMLHTQENDLSQVSQVSQVNRQVIVKLTGSLAQYQFPEKRESVCTAIRASLRFLDLASDAVTMPLYCAPWRAVLGEVDFGVHLAGQTGWGKTELCALIQQHYGPTMSAHKLPGSWESTENSLEMLLFQAKDTVVVVDDFKPKGGKVDQDRLHAKADRIFRQIGNGAARGRLTSNLEQRVERRPRCLLISTGEDVPRGQSLKARGIVLTMNERITHGEAARKLSEAQKNARSGLYAQAMAGFLEWLAPRIETIQAELSDLIAREREKLCIDGHARSSTNTANLLLGMRYFLQFACESGAITLDEAQALLSRCKSALVQVAEEAAHEDTQERPSEQWRRLLVTALTNKSAHLVSPKGENPGLEYGWVKSVRLTGREGEQREEETFRGGGSQIGWIDGDDIYLDPAAAYKVVRSLGSTTGDDVTTLEPTLRKFLVQDGMLASTGMDKARKTITVRRRLQNAQRDVLHITKESLFLDPPLSEAPDSPDLLDSRASDTASQAAPRVSQLLDSKGIESSARHDSNMTQHTYDHSITSIPANQHVSEAFEPPASVDTSQFTPGQWVKCQHGIGQVINVGINSLTVDVMNHHHTIIGAGLYTVKPWKSFSAA